MQRVVRVQADAHVAVHPQPVARFPQRQHLAVIQAPRAIERVGVDVPVHPQVAADVQRVVRVQADAHVAVDPQPVARFAQRQHLAAVEALRTPDRLGVQAAIDAHGTIHVQRVLGIAQTHAHVAVGIDAQRLCASRLEDQILAVGGAQEIDAGARSGVAAQRPDRARAQHIAAVPLACRVVPTGHLVRPAGQSGQGVVVDAVRKALRQARQAIPGRAEGIERVGSRGQGLPRQRRKPWFTRTPDRNRQPAGVALKDPGAKVQVGGKEAIGDGHRSRDRGAHLGPVAGLVVETKGQLALAVDHLAILLQPALVRKDRPLGCLRPGFLGQDATVQAEGRNQGKQQPEDQYAAERFPLLHLSTSLCGLSWLERLYDRFPRVGAGTPRHGACRLSRRAGQQLRCPLPWLSCVFYHRPARNASRTPSLSLAAPIPGASRADSWCPGRPRDGGSEQRAWWVPS